MPSKPEIYFITFSLMNKKFLLINNYQRVCLRGLCLQSSDLGSAIIGGRLGLVSRSGSKTGGGGRERRFETRLLIRTIYTIFLSLLTLTTREAPTG